MEDLGHRVLTAQNGPEALSIERAVSRFTDLVMPHGIHRGRSWGRAIRFSILETPYDATSSDLKRR